jgi:peptidoglycan/xylan/chitin deacetylase (PgdA/CDA1 family)
MDLHVITTSWDDGHPLDLKIAGLLARYELSGTFYVPRCSQSNRLTEEAIREISQSFEIGAHTLSHRSLTSLSGSEVNPEVEGSKAWVEEVTGKSCRVFAFPWGKFSGSHVSAVRSAGFVGCRTTELLSLAAPLEMTGLKIIPTTVQAYSHPPAAYARNILRRRAFRNLSVFFRCAGAGSWVRCLELILGTWRAQGGVLHLWGHSSEIDAAGEWPLLEDALSMLHDCRKYGRVMSNGELCAPSR